MRTSIFCAAALLLLLPSAGAAKDIRKETSDSQGRTRTVHLYVPPAALEAGAGRAAPLLVLLHGAKRDGSSLVKVWKGVARQEGIILAGLDAVDPAFWDTATDPPEVYPRRSDLSRFPVELTERAAINFRDLALYDAEPGKINREAWRFLSKHRLAAEPRFQSLTIEVEIED